MSGKSPLPEDKGPTFDPRVHWCPRHFDAFRPAWKTQPAAWVFATLGLFEVCVRRQDILDATGRDTKMLDRVLREYSPLCCLVGDGVTDYWTKLALGPMDEFKIALALIRETGAGD